MKQINYLLVCQVPKDASNFRVVQLDYSSFDQYLLFSLPVIYEGKLKLPPGQYEIIGLYSEVDEDGHKLIDIAMAADLRLSESIHDMLSQHSIPLPSDTTDLLFIHKLK